MVKSQSSVRDKALTSAWTPTSKSLHEDADLPCQCTKRQPPLPQGTSQTYVLHEEAQTQRRVKSETIPVHKPHDPSDKPILPNDPIKIVGDALRIDDGA